MIHCLRGPALLLLTFCFFQSCSSSTSNDKASKIADNPKKDSIALIYNAEKANKKIDEFMKELHRKYSFNGNVLVAKKERSFTKIRLVGQIICIVIV